MRNRLIDLIGDDNFVQVDSLGIANLYIKLEYLNPAGSIKFKTALGLIDSCERAHLIKPDSVLIESSSGNLGVALSVICASKRYKFACVIDPNTNEQNVQYMKSLGSEVICITRRDANGGFLGSRIAFIRDLIRRDPRYVWTNQYENEANPQAHADFTAAAIDRAFPNVDYLFVGTGTAGTLMGCIDYFSRRRPNTKVIAVDSVGSVTFGLPASKRYIPGLGASQQPPLFARQSLHAMIAVPEAASISMCRYLARVHGILSGGSTGTVLTAVHAYSERMKRADVVVAIAPDCGERYLNTIYDDEWVKDKFGWQALVAKPDSSALRITTSKELACAS
jgi:cysteine synthase A